MRILWHSNAPWLKSGYGQQTDIWTKRLRDLGHDVAIHGYAGAQHLTIEWDGITVYPAGTENAIGMDNISYWYDQHQADVIISLCDAWALSPRLMALMPSVCWTPVDAEPLSQGLVDFFTESRVRPLAMSRYGQRMFAEGPSGDGSDGMNVPYIPHGIPTDLFKPPEDRDALREESGFSRDTFVVGINQANRSGWRKALPEQIAAFASFWRRHPDSRLLLHMAKNGQKGQDLPLLVTKHGIPEGVVSWPDQGVYSGGVIGMDQMPLIYGAADVWMGCAMAGGFELPLLEAQACATPVIATDCSAMTEVAGPHSWLVKGQQFWVQDRHEGFWTMPFIHEIDAALEEAWQAREDGSIELRRRQSREHAMQYDADTVLRDYWVPFLAELEDDLTAKRPRKQAPPRTVWSPVMFRDELDMLEMRLHETDGLIDRHVIVEAETTHRGVPKPLYFRDSAGRFEAHASRITAVAGGALPDEQPWVNEHLQRDAAWTVIDAEASDDDIVLICDVDEIPSRDLLEKAKAGDLPEVCSVRMRTTLHAVDWEVPAGRVPPACVIATAGYIRHGGSLAAIRDKRDQYPVIPDGGWHFSWVGGPEAARTKLWAASCHTELLDSEEGDLIADGTRYRTGQHGAGGLPVVPAEIDDTWPEWIRERKCPPSWFRPRDRDLSDAALIITAWRRPDYLKRVLDSWVRAEGTAGLRRIVVALAPSAVEAEQRGIIAKAAAALGRDIEIRMDSPACATVPGPHRAIAEAANAVLADDPGCRFLIFGEEDIQVSSDVLSFIAWGREQAAGRALAVCAHNALGNGWQRDAPDDTDADQSAARFCRSFSPWAWGTWRWAWERVLEPQWDYDCNSGPRGDQHGYDWQMQRITERCGDVLVPDAARSQNIGRDGGVFAHPEEFERTQAKSFREARSPVAYRLEETA